MIEKSKNAIMNNSFLIPNIDSYSTEQIIKKSRFIVSLKKVQNKREALEFITSIKEKYKDARHNCWAYLIGKPNSPSGIGYSDDGEPKGTAGLPILNVLQQKNVSMTVIVVTRYFGGIKLGASGLVRAYSGTANKALEEIKYAVYEKKTSLKIKISYLYINSLQNFLTQNNVTILDSEYSDSISLNLEISEKSKEELIKQITEITKGTVEL